MTAFRYTRSIFIALLLLLGLGYKYDHLSGWWMLALAIVFMHLLVLGAIYIRWNFYFKSYHKGNDPKYIALTFDDGPAAETAAILDILKEQDVKAAFFSIGKNAAANHLLVKRWDEEGHLIGNHSYAHGFNFDWKTAYDMEQEIRATNKTIEDITGKTPRLFRPPYGVTNPNLARAVKNTAMVSVGWSLRSFDTKAKDGKQLLARILNKVRGGDIILLHDSMSVTREILTELIVRCREKGFTFVRVDKMLEIDGYK